MSGKSQAGSVNPSIKELQVGVRELRTVNIYPLSMADQFKMTDLIQEVIATGAKLADGEDGQPVSDIAIIEGMVGLVKKNIDKFIKLVTDPGDTIKMTELTNVQLSELVMIIYSVNYEDALKNFSDLFEKVRKVLPSKRSLPQSVNDMVDIGSKTSTEKVS